MEPTFAKALGGFFLEWERVLKFEQFQWHHNFMIVCSSVFVNGYSNLIELLKRWLSITITHSVNGQDSSHDCLCFAASLDVVLGDYFCLAFQLKF